jgi:hypothetical protein
MHDPFEVMDTALKTNYSGISPLLRKRYARLLVLRAIRFYIENQLDTPTVNEDLNAQNLQKSERLEQSYYKDIKNSEKNHGNRNTQSGTSQG